MAAFNLTAQLNLVGPTNVRQIVGDIRKQLGTIKGTIDLGIDPKAIRTIAQLQSQAAQVSSSLNNISRSASVAAGGINDLNSAAGKNQLGGIASSAAKTASAADDLGKQSSRASKDVKILSNELAEFGRQSGLAIRRFAAFSLVSGVMYKLNSAVNQALSQYIDFDRELVRVSQVTGKSVSELSSLVSEISSLATSTGVASKELIQVSSTLAQAGLSARDAEKALKALALSANAPSFDNLNDTVEGSIALMRQFGISADDLESALGSVNAVAAAFAVEASDLIAAIQRTGGVFASASRGVSEGTDALNEFIAVFTSVRATTRESAETIATGLRTIFTRIQRESTITALRELGVELRDVEGKFVGPYEAVRRLSEGLGALDPRSQTFAAIVEELGGFRQIGKVIPLIQQFATAEAALQVAMKGGDSLAEANRQAQQALAVQLAKTREEFVALVRDFANNTAFRAFLTTTISITKSILSLARAGRSLFPLLTIMGGFKAISAVTQFAGGFAQGVRPSGGKGGEGDEEGIDNKALSRTMGRSVSRSIGKGLGEMLSGSKTERQADSLEQIVSILRSNAQAFTADVSGLAQPITSLSALLNDNNSLLSANTSGLNNVYAALVNLEAAISGKSFTGPTTARSGGRILGFAKGGTVPGSGKGDKVPALLEPGEVVMSNRAVSRYGRGNLVRMNKYAKGGKPKRGVPNQVNTTDIVDGDTIGADIFTNLTFRFSGIDAPEKSEPLADKATSVLTNKELSYFNNKIISGVGGKSRGLFKDDALAGQMIRSGLAVPDIRYAKKNFNSDVQAGRAAGQGLWNSSYANHPKRLQFKEQYGYALGGKIQRFMAGGKVSQDQQDSILELLKAYGLSDIYQSGFKSSLTSEQAGLFIQNLKDNMTISSRFKSLASKYAGKIIIGPTGLPTVRRSEISTGYLLGSFGSDTDIEDYLTKEITPRGIKYATTSFSSLRAPPAPTYRYSDQRSRKRRFNWGGLIQNFMAGSPGGVESVQEVMTEEKAALLGRSEILRFLKSRPGGLEDTAKAVGISSANMYKILGVRSPDEKTKAVQDAIRKEYVKTFNRRLGAKKGVQTRLTGQGLKFAAAGMSGEPFDPETYDVGGRKVLITAGVMDPVLAAELDSIYSAGIESIAQEGAQKAIISNVTKGLLGGKQLELDFDKTLAVGADDIASLKDFRDPTIVQEKLKSASLTRLGRSLVDLVKSHPELIPNMRVVTARSQSTVALIQQWLADKGLALSDSQFVGVGGDSQIVSESDIPALKAAQLRTGSLFVDDSAANISAAEASGKGIETYQYGAQLTIPNPNAEATAQGVIFEKMLQNLGARGRVAGLGFDYPDGLGPAAKFFGIDPDIPTDAKRTIVGAGTIKNNVQTYLKATGYNSGGLVQRFKDAGEVEAKQIGMRLGKGRGKEGARGARSPIEPISSETYLKWAKGIYEEYDKDPSLVWTKDELGISMPPEIALANRLLTQYSLQTGGAGLSVGKRFVVTPEQYIDDALRPHLVPNPNNPNELGFYEDVIAKFGRAKAVSAAATKKIGKAEALKAIEARMKIYTSAENAIASFKKSGVLDVNSSIMNYLIKSVNNPDNLPLDSDDINSIKKKLTKSNVDAFNALVGSQKTTVSVQGQRTKLGEVFNAILETYGSDVSDLEVDNITRAMGQKLNIGGLIQKFAFGGKTDEQGFEEVRKQIMDKYPEIDFRISKRKKGRGFGYNLLGALKTDGGLLGSKGLQFEQPSNLQKLIEVSDKMATSLINPQELAIGGLADATSEMASLINDPNSVVRANKKPAVSSAQMALQYFQRANGGRLGFADGGSVPALVSNGEAYVPPKVAKRIGYSTLNKMNQADKNGMGRFSDGGISVFKGPGTGTSDSIPTSLPVGSFILREKATKALGLNKGGVVQRFADGGSPKGGTPNLYPGLDPKPFSFLEEMAIKAGNAFKSSSSIIGNSGNIFGSLGISYSALAKALDEYSSILITTGQITVDQENLMYRAYEKAARAVASTGDVKAMIDAEKQWVAALNSASDSLRAGIVQQATGPTTPSAPASGPTPQIPTPLPSSSGASTPPPSGGGIPQSAPIPTSAANPKLIPQIVPPVKENPEIPSKDIYFSDLSPSRIKDTVSKSRSVIKDIDPKSIIELKNASKDAGMSIVEFSSGLINARDTAIQSALEQGKGAKEAALAGQEAAISFGKLSELRAIGTDPTDALRSLLASSTRVQANVQERKEVLSDPAVISAIQETNKLVAALSDDEKLTYAAMKNFSKSQREDPAIQSIVGELTPALEKVFKSRENQRNVVGAVIERRQEKAKTASFTAPTIAGPTNLIEIEGVNNALAKAKTDAESYASSLRDQANNIRKQKETVIDPGISAALEAKAQGLEEKASEAEKAYTDLASSTQDSVDWFDTEYQTAIDTMRTRAESAAKATQDVEKAMIQRAKEISAENPQLTAEEIGQQISIENVGIVADAKAKRQEAEAAAGAAQSRVDTLAGRAGAGADIFAQDKAKAKAEADAKAEQDALEARKQSARDLGAKRAAIAVGSKREYETEEQFDERKKAATEKYTRQSAVQMGLSKTRFVSKGEKESIEKQRAAEKAAKTKELESTQSKTDVQAQASQAKATLLLVQALNANTNAQGGATNALDAQVAALDNTNKTLEETRIKNIEDKDNNDKQAEDDSALFQDELRTIPFLDTLESWSSSVNDFANGFAASSTDLNGKVSRMGGIFQGAASRIDSGIKGIAAALRNANTAFAGTSLGKFADSFSQYGTAIGGGVTMVTQSLADMSGGFDTTTGTVAQFAATISSQATIIGTVGAQFGPLGGIIGTVAGAAMGATRAFFDMQNAAREKARADLEMAKEDAMAEASSSFELALSNSSNAAEDFKAGLAAMTTVINAEKELLKTDTKSSQFTRGFMGFGGVRQKTGQELRESVQNRAAAEAGGAALSKQLLGGVMRSGNLTLDQTREKLGAEKFNALGGQIAEADTTFINARLDAADQMKKDIKAGMSKADAENKYRGAVDTARDASVRRALASQEAAIADEQYRKSVTEVRQRIEQQGTSFLKELIVATPKQRAEKRKDFEAAQGLMSGDMTKSREQQQAAFQKAYRETGGTPMQKMEAAQQAASEVRNRQQAAAEQILSFGDQKDQNIRNARAQLLETSLREQGINPNEGMAKTVLDSLRQQDPELQAQEKAAATTEANTKAIEDLTKAINDEKVGGGGGIYDAMTAENELGRTERETAITYGVGGATAIAGGAMAYRRYGRGRTTNTEMSIDTRELTPDEKAKYGIDDGKKPLRRTPPPVPATMAEAEARAAKAKPSTTAPKGGKAGRRGVFGLVRNLAVPAATAAVAAGAGYFAGGGGGGEATQEMPASPEIVQLLTAIETNTRNCCMGAGNKEATYTSAETQQNEPATIDNTKAMMDLNSALSTLSLGDPADQNIRHTKANLIETSLKQQEINPNEGMFKTVLDSLRQDVQPVSAGQAKATIVAEQLQNKGIDISTDDAQTALNAIASSTDPAVTSMANVAAMSDMLAQKFGELSAASEVSGESQASSGEEAQQAATETRSAALDWVQAGLDIAGLIPLVGEFADGANAAIYGLRAAASTDPGVQKDLMVDAGLSAAATIPFAGMAATAVKGTRYAAKATKTLGKTGLDVAENVAGEALDYGIMSASEGAITAGVESLPLGEAQNESAAQEAESGKGFITSAMESIGTTIWDSGSYLTSALQTGFGMLPGLLDGLFRNIIPMAASALWNGLKMLASGIYEAGAAAIGTLWSGIKALPTVIYELGASALSGLWESTKVLSSVMLDTAMAAIGGLWEGVKALPGFIYETGMSALGMLWSGISSLPGLIIDGIVGIFKLDAAIGSFIGEQVYNIGKAIYDGAASGIQYIVDIWPKLPDIIYQAFLDGSLFILDGMVAAGQWVQDQFFRVLGNITNGINDVAFSIISKIPGGKSIAKNLGLTDPAERAKKEQNARENEQPQVQTRESLSTRRERQQNVTNTSQTTGPAIQGTQLTQQIAQVLASTPEPQTDDERQVLDDQLEGLRQMARANLNRQTPTSALSEDVIERSLVAGPAITGTALTQAVTQAQAVREQQALSPNTIVDQAGNFIPAVGPAGSGAAITEGSALMREAAAYDAEIIAQSTPTTPNVLQQFETMAAVGLPTRGETNNLFTNPVAEVARVQIPAPTAPQTAGGVTNTRQSGAPQAAATGMSQLTDTAAIGTSLQAAFGQFVTDLQNVQLPKIPDVVTMEGKHTVEVILNGAEVLKSIEPMIKDLIDQKLNKFKTNINNATEGGISGMG